MSRKRGSLFYATVVLWRDNDKDSREHRVSQVVSKQKPGFSLVENTELYMRGADKARWDTPGGIYHKNGYHYSHRSEPNDSGSWAGKRL